MDIDIEQVNSMAVNTMETALNVAINFESGRIRDNNTRILYAASREGSIE